MTLKRLSSAALAAAIALAAGQGFAKGGFSGPPKAPQPTSMKQDKGQHGCTHTLHPTCF